MVLLGKDKWEPEKYTLIKASKKSMNCLDVFFEVWKHLKCFHICFILTKFYQDNLIEKMHHTKLFFIQQSIQSAKTQQ